MPSGCADPNHARVANLEAVCAAVKAGATLRGVACEKPLARRVAEAKRMLALAEQAGLRHGYLENQIFAPAVTPRPGADLAPGAPP